MGQGLPTLSRRSRRAIAPRLALLAAATGVISCLGCAEPEPPKNVLFIVVDTLRWDHVGVYGAARATTPAIDALAADSVRFERAYSTAPWTIPSVASMLTGLYPHAHGAMHFRSQLPPSVDTLAEILSAQGYATAASVSHTVLNRLRRFGQGFDRYLDSEAQGHKHLSTPGVTDQAIAFLKGFEKQDRPFFLFIHYFDPHYAFRHHPQLGFTNPPVERLTGSESITRLREMLPEMTRAELDFILALYDEEIRFTDGGIGRVLDALRELGLDDETLVVFTADHGEEFGERGWLGHTTTLRE
ncbi:MAG: sulfatase, partial [Deltaproteobacteria bacterium]|nr:sulfatase [Deltaproteobacteria bacterium]